MEIETINLTYHQRLAGTPGELLAIEGMAEAARAGNLLGLHVSPSNEVITAYAEGEPVAVLVFVEYECTGELWVHFGYCLPEFRRQGYYRACIERLRILARKRGFSRINTAAAPNNAAAIASIQARGGQLQYLGFTFPTE
jgi:GNAT superfamily N-acetyltransferase